MSSMSATQPDSDSFRTANAGQIELVSLPESSSGSAAFQVASSESERVNDADIQATNEVNLPPVDGGFNAWAFLAAAFVVEGVVWGFPDAYGIFLNSYLQDPRFASQKDSASLPPLIGTLSSGIIYCSAPIITPIAARYPQHRQKSMWLGVALCSGTLIAASYATKIWQLIILQGVLYALGGAILYLPCISYMSEWFVRRIGMANGILFGGTAAGGLLIPLILPRLTSAYGLPTTLRVLGIAMAVLITPLLPFIKGRHPPTRRARVQGPVPRGAPGPRNWIRQPSFWLLIAVNSIQASAYFVPIVYLPTFAHELNLSTSKSAVTVALLNASSIVGRLSMGYLSDTMNPWMLAFSVFLSTSLTSFILWGVVSHTFVGLLVFGSVYGAVAGGWTCLWSAFVKPLAKEDVLMSTTLYGYLLLSRGLGNIISTPISARLYAAVHNRNPEFNMTSDVINSSATGFDVGDGRFGKMIIYVGTTFAGAAGVAVAGWVMDVRKRRRAGVSATL
ncbi:major facilitator superfamily domain-containing protein [Roridomyces roridus]|uniref:Major facilitator superfamily domain-containing protein n=1 Tax=Roridomyces roridus TaxID=1738132 RepID=A0AAD7CAC2_9AGAR|nr:major facilitator superfamily domain-containing protein [Roridomyces roridus]